MSYDLNRRQFVTAAGAVGLTALAGCSGSDSGGGNTLSWHAGGTGGTYYPLSNNFKIQC
ncbi:hypothetical protein SAMN05192552_105712 [Natrinema hispanicum]|uniref:Uncharacterized protein n=1 Tax=Natrinema hispanicum TaxID=392421 RepID=A0A1G6Y2L7_9EURY|nr:hypothetical protein SAMN05192552_105712 [Natrinema hispanicum]